VPHFTIQESGPLTRTSFANSRRAPRAAKFTSYVLLMPPSSPHFWLILELKHVGTLVKGRRMPSLQFGPRTRLPTSRTSAVRTAPTSPNRTPVFRTLVSNAHTHISARILSDWAPRGVARLLAFGSSAAMCSDARPVRTQTIPC
jgi:hypothetical protein